MSARRTAADRARALDNARASVDSALGLHPTAPVAPQHADAVRALLRRAETELVGEGDTRARIFAAIQAERERQDAKWGQQNHPDVDRTLTDRGPSRYQGRTSAGGCTPPRMAEEYGIPTPSRARANCQGAASNGQVTWAHILVEEVAELVEAATLAQQGRGPDADVDSELVQVAAVCVSWLEARARLRALVGEG